MDLCSLEVADAGTISKHKAELYSCLNGFVRDCFAAKEMDVSQEDLNKITELCLEMGPVDVAAICNPERFTEMAPRLGLRPGFVIDLQTGWNLELEDHVNEIDELVDIQDTFLIIGSPPCTEYCGLLNLRKHVRSDEANAPRKAKGRYHLELQ